MRRIFGLMQIAVLAMVPIAGCGPGLPEEEYGTLLFEVPEIPGAEDAYELPPARPAPDDSPPDSQVRGSAGGSE